jgi:hypothetical protein
MGHHLGTYAAQQEMINPLLFSFPANNIRRVAYFHFVRKRDVFSAKT